MTLPTWRTLAIIGAAVAAVLLLGLGGWLWTSAQQQRGIAAYAETLERARQGESPSASPEARMQAIRGLEGVLAQYPSNAMAPQAAYELGNLRFAAHEYDKARAAYQVAIAKTGSGTLATLARAGIGYAWESERKFTDALQAYQAALADLKSAAFYYEELLVDLARAQELAGRKDEAIITYRRILKDLPRSARADDVRNRLASLGVAP
jgi:tetratricopeptide (TPR) repeat protein